MSPTDKRPYSRHGKNALMARVKLRGLSVLDKRTAAARSLIAWEKEIRKALGSEAAANPEKKALIDLAVRTRLFIESIDFWLLGQQSLVSAKHRAVLPAVRERQALADSLARYLAQLGIGDSKPAAHTPEEIHAFLSGKGNQQ